MGVKQIPKVTDPEDRAGARCNVLSDTGLRCHRRLGHSSDTQAIYTFEKALEDGTKQEVKQVVVFNHRSLMGGYFFTW